MFTSREYALAITGALLFWSDSRYARHLPLEAPMTAEWFSWFIAEWRVARTVNVKERKRLLNYLNGPFRRSLVEGKRADYVTTAALHIAKRGWSRTHPKSGTGSLPLSLASKIAFLIDPSRFAPMDSFSRAGLRKVCGLSGAEGRFARYEDYLMRFDSLFDSTRHQLAEASTATWVAQLGKELHCRSNMPSSLAFKRKVLDNLLMGAGGRSSVAA